jgi:predicted nucleotidyltransferase
MKRFIVDFDHIRQFAPQLYKIAKKFGVSKIYVFGSVARGDNTSKSDVDFLVDILEGASLFGVAGFNYEIELLLGVPVDVVPLSVLNRIKDQNFAIQIQKDAILL